MFHHSLLVTTTIFTKIILYYILARWPGIRGTCTNKFLRNTELYVIQNDVFKIKLSPMVENMALSKTIEIHSITKKLEREGQKVNYIFCNSFLSLIYLFNCDAMKDLLSLCW